MANTNVNTPGTMFPRFTAASGHGSLRSSSSGQLPRRFSPAGLTTTQDLGCEDHGSFTAAVAAFSQLVMTFSVGKVASGTTLIRKRWPSA